MRDFIIRPIMASYSRRLVKDFEVIKEGAIKDTARIMISPLCNKTCSYCCNNHEGVMDKFRKIESLDEISTYPIWCITGGEPMLFPDKVKEILQRGIDLGKEVYLYTAQHTKYLEEVIPMLSGFTYTVHKDATLKDRMYFFRIQRFLLGERGKPTQCNSRKLLIDPQVMNEVLVCHGAWDDVEVAVWKETCDIRDNEDFFRLDACLNS